jgi:2-dehydropantoate 2-reductase
MKIGVMGTGGVGGYFGGLFAQAGFDIHFIARGRHRQAIYEEGLLVVSNHGSFRTFIHATSEPYDIGPVDLILFCVKSYDTLNAAHLIEPLVDTETVILSLQDGVDNTEKLIQQFGIERVMGGTAFVEASLASPGIVAHTGKPGRIVFGEFSGERTERAEKILNTFLKAGIDTTLSESIEQVMWSRFLFICGVHGVSTLSRSSLELILACPETRQFLIGAMREVESLARQRGVSLPDDVVAEAIALAESFPEKFKCTMLRDLEWRRQMEIEALNGMVVRLGKECGVETPLNSAIYACLKLENQKMLDPFWLSQPGE